MADFDPTPPDDRVAAVRRRWSEDTETFERVYETVLGVTAPTAYTAIAETADCAPNTAKKHCERLTEMGIARANREGQPTRYERNDAYLEWQDVSRIAADLSVEEIIDRVQQLEARRAEFEDRFDTTDPSAVSVFDQDDHTAIHERMAAVSEWHALDRNIRRYELARQLARNDGHLLPV